MKPKKTKAASLASLRKKAETKLRKQDAKVEKLSPRNVRDLAHELGTYQIELEMQNEELRNAQEELEASRSKYVDLYDFAPVGYFTLDKNGLILEVNLTGADMLGVNSRILLKKPFSSFIPERGDQALFHAHRKNFFLTQTRQTCEIKLTRKKNPPFIAQLISRPSETIDGEAGVSRTAVLDITERRQAEEELAKYRKHLEKLVDVRTEELQAANEELQATNEELHTADEKLRSVLDNSRDVIYRVNALTGRYEYISPASVNVVGFSPDELMTQKSKMDLDMVYPDDLPAMRAALAHLEETDQADLEYRQRTKNGDYRWISDHVRLIRDGAGRPLYRDGNIRDITDSKRAEEALRESEKQFRTLADSIPNLAWWANGDGYITWYNNRWYEYTGTTPQQMEGWGWQSVHDPKILPIVLERWKASIATGVPFDMEFPLRGADGVFRPFLTRVQPLKDSGGLVIRWFGTNTDVSGMRQAEEALRKSEERFRNMFERHQAVMLLVEPETGAIIDANASAAEFYGWSIEALRSLSIQDINQLSLDDVASERKRALEEDRNYFIFQHKLADGRVRWVEVYSSPITVQGRSLLFSIIHDITERKQAEEALHQAVETFEKVFKGNAAALALSRIEDGLFLEVNDRFLEMTGYSREEVIGKKPPVAWKNPEDRAAMIREVQELGAITGREYRILRKNGVEFIALFFAQSINLRGQELMISSAVDITESKQAMEDAVAARRQAEETNVELQLEVAERKHAEEALQRSEEKYRNIIETASEGIWIGDFEGRTTFVNESAAKMIGYRPEELIGKTALDFMDEEARAIGRLNLERRRQGQKNSYEVKFIRKDGSTLWAIVGATPLRDKNGNIVASMAMITDITERKLAEEKTLHQQAVLTSINRIFREALATDSEEELGRACLSIAEELTGSKFGFIAEIGPDGLLHDIAISDPGWDLCTMKDKTVHHKPLGPFKVHGLVGRVIIDERPFFTNDPYSHHDSIGTPEGHPRLTAFLGVPLVHRGKTIGLIALGNREGGYRAEDVETMEPLATVIVQALMRKRIESSLQAAHAELKQRAYELEAVNRDLEIYSYAVSHDLKAPLRSVDGFARALLEDYGDKLDSTARDYLVRINSATLRMGQLIQAMLDMARLTRRDLNEQSVDLSALAQVIADDLRKQDPARMVEFIIADTIRVRGDNTLLQTVLENLMQNAWKFTGKHKAARIEFGVTTMEGHPVYFVKDDGAGFDMQFADKLFLPFKRLHADSEFPGLGIGLATAYRIILRHNGRLWAESALEKGATFYFTLP